MRRAGVLVAGVVLAGVVVRAPFAWACSCIQSTVKQQVAAATAVFEGVAAATETPVNSSGYARFTVERVFKGRVGVTTEVGTLPFGNSCRIDVAPGTRYAVFATAASGGGLMIGACSGTTPDSTIVARAGFKSHAPRAAAPPSLDPGEVALTDNPGRGGTIAAAALLLAAAALAMMLVRGRFGRRREEPV